MIVKQDKKVARQARHARVRTKVSGTPECPRLAVFRSNKHMEAQIIDDVKGITLVSASTFENGNKLAVGSNIEAAKFVGETVAKRALEKNIKKNFHNINEVILFMMGVEVYTQGIIE